MRIILLAIFGFVFFYCAQVRAEDQLMCNKRDKILEHLARNYSEAPTAIGMDENGGVVEVLTSNDGSTWTILLTTPAGMSCLVAMGNSWEPVQRVATGPQA